MKTRYALRTWEWNGEEYDPFITPYQSEEKARSIYNEYEPCDDIPQIDLVLQIVDKYGVISQKNIEVKD